ncbi:MAG: U32 family peptidase [Tissierella sp.]|nr:U32 family peptidase [Tissierella sp.]
MESLYAAVQNGANAVYLGGKLFNARYNATNFDRDELKAAIKYAHLNDVKVYITVNILLDDSEIEESLDYIRFLYEIDVDAIIVQDIGLASLVRDLFPKLPIHGSTQMTINNLYGAKHLEDLGFTRVVLARETPLKEIQNIKANTNIELESFVHGALCVSYSGQCLMSSMIGGRSGNRGRCAQPCRMQYSIVDKEGSLVNNWEKKYVLSPRDLNTMEYLDKIVESGITSLKIEGRMKRPEYVATIVSNYRKTLDEGLDRISEQNKKDITQIFNREFTKGITLDDFGRSFISYDRPDNRGIVLGYVSRVDKYKVYIMLEDDVEEGDGIEFSVQNGGYKGLKVPISGKKGTILTLEKPGYIEKDSLVYKTSSQNLLKKAKSSYEDNKKTYPLDMKVDIRIGEKPSIELNYKDYKVNISLDTIVEKAQKAGLNKEKVSEQLTKLGDTSYHLSNLEIHLEEGSFLPMSSLNKLRRDSIDKLNDMVVDFHKRERIDDTEYKVKKQRLLSFNHSRDIQSKNKLNIMVSNRSQYEQLNKDKLDRIYLGFYDDIDDILFDLKNRDKEIYIWTDKILYTHDLKTLDKIIKPIANKIDGIAVSNIGTFEFVREMYDLDIHGDIGLNLFNSYTARYFNSNGVASSTLSPELTLGQINNITKNSDFSLEAIVYGYLPVMITKTCPMALVKGCKDDKECSTCNFAKGYGLKDRMDMVFYMNRNGGSSTIYNSVPVMVLDSLKSILNSGVTDIRLDFTLEKDHIRQIQSVYYDYLHSRIDEDQARDFIDEFKEHTSITKGHYYRGIL